MPYTAQHLAQPPSRDDVDRLTGATVVEFGTPWCGHCQRAQPLIEQALKDRQTCRTSRWKTARASAWGARLA